MPTADSILVERLKAAGAIIIGKTNTSEFGLGSHTFNDVFGPTRNPYDLTKTAGGSSGGAGVALALRMLPLADGSDFSGSLRNPAAYNNVYGLRPTYGRVPGGPAPEAFLSQLGLASFLKTSGGKGLHIVVPLRRLHDWDTVKGFSQAIVMHLSTTIAQRFVAKSGPKNRVGKIFVDYLRNGSAATTVCAWSARARPGLGISVPVDWRELDTLRGSDHWNVRTVHQRLDQGNQPWSGYKAAAQSLSPAMKTLNYPKTKTNST